MPNSTSDTKLIIMLLERLERISVDSIWAHRASGIRGSLLRIQDQFEEGHPSDPGAIKFAMRSAFQILREAAKELR